MFKRVISGTSRAFVFLIGPSLKCSYQNMATTLPKAVAGPIGPTPPNPMMMTKEVNNKFQSKTVQFRGKEFYGRGNRRKFYGLGYSLGLLGFFEKKEELTVEDKILMELKRAILAIQDGEIKKAEAHLKKAWDMSEEEDLEKAKTQILDIRANLAFQVGDLVGAEKLFKLVCQRLVYHQDVSVKDNAIVEISLKLSQIMSLTGRHEESMSGFQYCVDTQKDKIEKEGVKDEDTLVLAAWSMHSLAQAYMSRASQSKADEDIVKKASDLAHQAYDLAASTIGPDSQQAVAINSDLASILALQGDIDAALERYKECEAIVAEKHTYLQPAIRVNTGSVLLQKGNYDEAERLCREAKKLARKYHDKESALRAEECILKCHTIKTENDEEGKSKQTTESKASASA